MTETTPQVKGGQGIIMLGTLSIQAADVEMMSLLKGVETALGLTPETDEQFGYDRAFHFNKLISERFARLEALGAPWKSQALNQVFHQSKKSAKLLEKWHGGPKEQPSELKVAVKVFSWKQDDLMESARFFKVCMFFFALLAS